MLTEPASRTIEHLTSTVIIFFLMVLTTAIIGYLAARHFGGNSRLARKTIFSTVTLVGLLGTGTYLLNRVA